MKRILIATPLKGDIPSSYFKASLQLATMNSKDYKFDWCLLDGPAVQQARNELAHYAVQQGFDEVVFWDKDVVCEQDGENLTAGAVLRLLKHDVDIVCAIYSTRSIRTHWHINMIPGQTPDDEGLQKVTRSAIGFSKIKTSVFKRIAKDNPWRVAVLVDPNKNPQTMPELFPMGLKGPGTPEERLKSITDALSQPASSHEVMVKRIERLATIQYDQPNAFISEDYQFCDLATASGFDIHIDSKLIMGHRGTTTFPIETPQLLECLSEPWRKEEIAAIRTEMLAAQKLKKD